MSKHTPGPWVVLADIDDDVHVVGPMEVGRTWMESTVATIRNGARVDANARLIAAAPDLLKALREIARALESDGEVTHKSHSGMVLAAIAKAEGTHG